MEIKRVTELGELHKDKLESLVKDGFGRSLVPDYFNDFNPESVYIAHSNGDYLGTIVFERTPLGFAYLDKFVVSKKYHNNSVGTDLWTEMAKHEKKIFWRAKHGNPINKFYKDVCDGMQKANGWYVYWVGLTPEELNNAIKYALSKKETLKPLD